jgi:ABC-2 type transport system ATP-binding protein
MQPDKIASLRGVTKRFGSNTALDNLTLELRQGELLALLGPNGAGKTSSVRLLLGLSSPDAGSVTVFGGDPRRDEHRRRTGAMLQSGGVPETLRVREHIALFSSYYEDPLPLAEVLRIARLEALSSRLFRDLSGGEKQRVMFALAICGNPDFLVLDEPTVGLDVETRRALWEEIRLLREQGRTILLTTHYLAEADALADRIAVIDRGGLIADGTPAEIKRRAAGRKLTFRTSARFEEIQGIVGHLTIRCSGEQYEILTEDGEGVARLLLNRLTDLRELEISGAGLEEAFIELTRQEAQVA